jgi:arsenate reductase (glutaredoxin)
VAPELVALSDPVDLDPEAADGGSMTASVKIYGIRNCDTMKKAFAWLEAHGVAYDFHDYKKSGVSEVELSRWSGEAGWEKLLNRAGTTFRKLPEADQQDLTRDKAIALMIANPSMIKRPVLESGEALEIGFRPERYAALFHN